MGQLLTCMHVHNQSSSDIKSNVPADGEHEKEKEEEDRYLEGGCLEQCLSIRVTPSLRCLNSRVELDEGIEPGWILRSIAAHFQEVERTKTREDAVQLLLKDNTQVSTLDLDLSG